MKQLKLRWANPEEAKQILEWLTRNPQNHFDPGILDYKTVQVLCSYDGEPECYMPIHRVLMMESIAPRPGASELNIAQSLRDFTKACELVASAQGIREIYFLGGDGKVGSMSLGGHGFEELPLKVFRMKLDA